jgi:tetratricopeptide (TPR) repeat protein
MRPKLIPTWLILILSTGACSAGIYSTAEPPLGPVAGKAMSFEQFRFVFDERLGLMVDPPLSKFMAEKRKEYQDKIDALEKKTRSGAATAEDAINLSAYQMWMGKPERAVQLLEPLAGGEHGRNPMVLSNLATARQLTGQLDRVGDYLIQAISLWPAEWSSLSKEQVRWYRQVEEYQLWLVQLRKVEASRHPPGTRWTPEGVDALFPLKGVIRQQEPVRFVGDSGSYEAGKIAGFEKQKLPADALAIVQQLMLWFPQDTRLYWLLAEVLNASGEPENALVVMDQCVGSRSYESQELRDHRRVLQEYQSERKTTTVQPSILPPLSALLKVGIPAGLVILMLVWLQVREIRRRRAARAASTGDGDAVPTS